jgi:uncharacterized protein YihD (DUF1040 family)
MSVDSKLPPYVKELIYKYKDNTKKQYSKHLGYLFYMNYGKYNPYESGDVEIVSEDENLKIVKVLSKDAAFYFGGDLYSQNWDHNFRDGDLYFLISSDPDVQVFSIHNRDNQDASVVRYGYDGNHFKNADDIKKYFPKSIKVLNPIIRFGETYEFLKSIYNGYEPRWNENGGDKIIGEIKFNRSNPNNSIVVIEFNDEEDFLNIFDLDENDIYEWRYYMSDYSNVDYDTYRYTEDWNEGDFFQYAFDDQNKEKLINIVRTFFPSTDITDTKKISLLANEIDSNFVDRVVDEYASEWETCVYNAARDEIRSEVENPFIKFGIKEKSLAYKYESTVGVLLTWYKQLKSEDVDLGGLLKGLIDKFDRNNYRGNWGEIRYNTDCHDWNNEAYQTYVSDRLDKIIEKYEEDERFVNYYEFIELQQKIDQEYGFGKWIPVKTDKNIYFKIDKIDPGTNKVIITFRNNQSDNREEQRSVEYDDLKRIETQYELFEEIKKIVGRLK